MTAVRDASLLARPSAVRQPMDAERSAALRCWLAFGALALYGTLRWATMLPGSDGDREFLALAVTLALAGLLRKLVNPEQRSVSPRRRWDVGSASVVLVAVALVGIAGFPVHLLLGLHFARFGSALTDGISGLPGLLVPYIGGDPLVAAGLVLGGAALLFAASLVFGTANRLPGVGRLALTALPLLVLAAVPSAIVTPRYVSLHGLVLFVLMVLLLFAPRLSVGRVGAAGGLVALATAIGTLGAGVIPGDHRWTDLATGPLTGIGVVAGTGVEHFNWQQTYGAQAWPSTGVTVLKVSAPTATLWKAEDLDAFNGSAWTQMAQPTNDYGDLDGVSAATMARWTETLQVHVGQMHSGNVIAAGYANAPDVPGAEPGVDPGTWVTDESLTPGESYRVSSYVPQPSATQLAAAGTAYPRPIEPFRTLGDLPTSPYGPVQALAQQLSTGVRTPYGYVEALLHYFRHGYIYTLNPPSGGKYPLADFLLRSRRGYCQQFAGAMALLLRMKGVPARVAVGFSSGVRQRNSDTYLVGDEDAHAWVEVWFPHYGWVTFDPTPGQAGGTGSGAAAGTSSAASAAAASTDTTATTGARVASTATSHTRTIRHHTSVTGAGPDSHASSEAGSNSLLRAIGLGGIALLALFALALCAGFGAVYVRRPSVAQLAGELDRAFARCGQPLGAELTLTALSTLLGDSPKAAAYVAALEAERYGPGGRPPAASGRTALRRWLRQGSGPLGWLRALWALPPRRPAAGH